MEKRYLRLVRLLSHVWINYKTGKNIKLKLLAHEILNKQIFQRSWIIIIRNTKNNAAKIIQKHVKGYLCRLKMPNQLKMIIEYYKLNRNARTIQKNYKGFIVRKTVFHMKKAATKIKSFFISKKNSSNFKKTLKSIKLIQKRVRIFLLRIPLIKQKLSEFLIKELGLLENLKFLERSNLFSKNKAIPIQKDIRLQLLSSLTESNARLAKSKLTSSGSLAIQVRQVNPFHLEKLYFFCRVLSLDLFCDNSIIYEPL